MKKANNIINLNISLKWVLLLFLYLGVGTLAKNYFGYFNIILFTYFILDGKPERSLYLTIIWIFISRYFVGMQYLELSGINNHLDKIFLFILLFIHFRKKYIIPKSSFISKVLVLHIILIILLIISFLFHQYNFLRILVSLNYFLLFIVVIISGYEREVYILILNLMLAIGIIQIPVAACQYLGIIKTPDIRVFVGHSTLLINQGPDDVACGTFGPMASADLSIYLTLLSLILFGAFLFEKKNQYLYWSFYFLLQYLVVDSKTALAITVFIYILLIIKVNSSKYAKETSFNLKNLGLITVFAVIFFMGIKSYYNTSFSGGHDFNFYISYIKKSTSIMYKYFGEWGKITGFRQVYKQQYKEGNLNNVLFGFGIDKYNTENRRFYIKERISPKMKLLNYANNFLNNDSSFIVMFADFGICGLLIIFMIYFSIYDFFSKEDFSSSYSKIIQLIIKPFLIGILIFGFIYLTLKINSFSMVGLWLIIALAVKIDEQPAE